jgi:hypothetical protein
VPLRRSSERTGAPAGWNGCPDMGWSMGGVGGTLFVMAMSLPSQGAGNHRGTPGSDPGSAVRVSPAAVSRMCPDVRDPDTWPTPAAPTLVP